MAKQNLLLLAGIAAAGFLIGKKSSTIVGITGTAKRLFTVSGREIKVRPNYSAKTFTITTNSGKYRTTKMPKEEFESAAYWTGQDWQEFLKGNDYYSVK